MTTTQALDQVVQDLPEPRLSELLDFARFLRWRADRVSWQEMGRANLSRAYGDDEPEYTDADLKPDNAR